MLRRPASVVLTALALTLGAAACDGDDGDQAEPTTTTSAPATTTTAGAGGTATTAPAAACDPPPEGEFGPGPEEGERQGDPPALLQDVEVTPEECVEVVRFAFDDALPGYRVGAAQPPFHEDGSGRVVEVEGEAFLEVRFEGATGYDFEEQSQAYEGPAEIRPEGTTFITEIERTGDFEGIMSWVIGLDAPHAFAVDVVDQSVVVRISAAAP